MRSKAVGKWPKVRKIMRQQIQKAGEIRDKAQSLLSFSEIVAWELLPGVILKGRARGQQKERTSIFGLCKQ